MNNLSLKAKVYLWLIILGGGILLAWNLLQIEATDWFLILILSGLASGALIFKVEGTTSLSHYNTSFFVYAFTLVLLGTPAAMLVILISNIVEWIWNKYEWYIQVFNLGMYFITSQFMSQVYQWMNPSGGLAGAASVFALIVAVATFTLLNHLIVGLVVWLVRGESFAKSGIFDFLPLVIDFTLLAMGATGALLWSMSPFAVVLAALPLYMVYGTLRVPGLERKTEIDPKTGLFNDQYFRRVLQGELERANRFERPVTVVMADMDSMRNINNTYGHLAGDDVLIGVAELLKKSFRDVDTVARFGGEEFAILMPETTPEEIYEHVEEIRANIQATPFQTETSLTPIHVTISFGIAGRIDEQLSAKELIHSADSALYRAKLNGRNTSCIASQNDFQGLFQGCSQLASLRLPQSESATVLSAAGATSNQPSQKKDSRATPLNEAPTKKTTRRKPLPGATLNLYIVSLVAACAILYFFLSRESALNSTEWLGMVIFTSILVLAEWFSLEIYGRDTSISTSVAPMLAGALLFGPFCSLVMSLAFALISKLKHNSKWSRVTFNFSNHLLASLFCFSFIRLSNHSFSEWGGLWQILLVFASAVIFFYCTTFAITLAMHLDAGLALKSTWKEKFSWLLPYYIVLGFVGLILIVAYQIAGVISAGTILIPLFLLRFSQKQYLDRTRGMVSELKNKNIILENNAREISLLNDGLLNALAHLIDLRDPYVLGHSQQVTDYAVKLASRLGLPKEQIELIRNASLLHDIGKLGIPENILRKAGPLTADERAVVQDHSLLGARILAASNALIPLIPAIRHHHERYDGTAYPDRLAGAVIPLEARIVAIADAVDSMASDRPYRRAMHLGMIVAEVKHGMGTQFDPEIAGLMIEILQEQGRQSLINSAQSAAKNLRLEQIARLMPELFEPALVPVGSYSCTMKN